MRAALGRVAADGVTADEVTRAARRLIGARAAALRTGAAIADALVGDEACGLPIVRLSALSGGAGQRRRADKVARAARRVLDPKREVIAVVRPAERRTRAGDARSGAR